MMPYPARLRHRADAAHLPSQIRGNEGPCLSQVCTPVIKILGCMVGKSFVPTQASPPIVVRCAICSKDMDVKKPTFELKRGRTHIWMGGRAMQQSPLYPRSGGRSSIFTIAYQKHIPKRCVASICAASCQIMDIRTGMAAAAQALTAR